MVSVFRETVSVSRKTVFVFQRLFSQTSLTLSDPVRRRLFPFDNPVQALQRADPFF
jgi:hypothetical protein